MNKRILIAEDERSLIAIYRLMLGDRFDIIEACNGEEAVELFRSQRPDLTLMDIRMPVKNGDEAIAEILEIDGGAKIIAVTAYNYTEEQLGVPVLRKGFTSADFLEAIGKLLED